MVFFLYKNNLFILSIWTKFEHFFFAIFCILEISKLTLERSNNEL